METKQTAVEWLEDALSNLNTDICNTKMTFEEYHKIRIGIWVQAKQMEKEQKRDSFNESRLTNPMIGFKHNNFEQYYNETYGK
jgi:hypothetical protein